MLDQSTLFPVLLPIHITLPYPFLFFFFFNDTATTEIYTLSLHDALPISRPPPRRRALLRDAPSLSLRPPRRDRSERDRKSTRLNSSHSQISYAVFCLKKKKKKKRSTQPQRYNNN